MKFNYDDKSDPKDLEEYKKELVKYMLRKAVQNFIFVSK